MKKDTVIYIAIGSGLILLYLLWRKSGDNQTINIMNDSANPNNGSIVQVPILRPNIGASCGCNPNATKMLSGSVEAFKKAENDIEAQLKAYTDSINNYFATQILQ